MRDGDERSGYPTLVHGVLALRPTPPSSREKTTSFLPEMEQEFDQLWETSASSPFEIVVAPSSRAVAWHG